MYDASKVSTRTGVASPRRHEIKYTNDAGNLVDEDLVLRDRRLD